MHGSWILGTAGIFFRRGIDYYTAMGILFFMDQMRGVSIRLVKRDGWEYSIAMETHSMAGQTERVMIEIFHIMIHITHPATSFFSPFRLRL